MKRTMRILKVELFVAVIISLIIVALYETLQLPVGVAESNKNLEFILTCIMELFTICFIPLSLRLFKFSKVQQALKSSPKKSLLFWGSIRMSLLTVPMVINTIMYYLFQNVAFGYMAIVGLICLIFIYPSWGRCMSEVTFSKE